MTGTATTREGAPEQAQHFAHAASDPPRARGKRRARGGRVIFKSDIIHSPVCRNLHLNEGCRAFLPRFTMFPDDPKHVTR